LKRGGLDVGVLAGVVEGESLHAGEEASCGALHGALQQQRAFSHLTFKTTLCH
jgi:hypothetical protein